MQRGTNLQKGHPREHFTMFYLRYMGIQEGTFVSVFLITNVSTSHAAGS